MIEWLIYSSHSAANSPGLFDLLMTDCLITLSNYIVWLQQTVWSLQPCNNCKLKENIEAYEPITFKEMVLVMIINI